MNPTSYERAMRRDQQQRTADEKIPGAEHVEISIEDLFVDDVDREPTLVDLPVLARKGRQRGVPLMGLGIALAAGFGLIGMALGMRRR